MRLQVATLALCAVAVSLFAASTASADTVDFSGLANGTAVTNQYPGVVFSLKGGPDSSGSPTTYSYSGGEGLANSNNSDYPTANILDIAFTAPVSNLSFTFDNYGDSSSTTYSAYNSSLGLVASSNISALDGSFLLVTVPGSGITDLQINNGVGASSDWYFAIQEISFTPEVAAAPEPSSLVLLGTGLLGLVGAARRKLAS